MRKAIAIAALVLSLGAARAVRAEEVAGLSESHESPGIPQASSVPAGVIPLQDAPYVEGDPFPEVRSREDFIEPVVEPLPLDIKDPDAACRELCEQATGEVCSNYNALCRDCHAQVKNMVPQAKGGRLCSSCFELSTQFTEAYPCTYDPTVFLEEEGSRRRGCRYSCNPE